MSVKPFFLWLLLIVLATALLLAGLHFAVPAAQPHAKLAIGTVALFALICIGLFFAGRNSARSSNKHAFTGLVSVSVFGKMMVSVGFLLLYQKAAKPQNEWFVAIFLLVYVIFTVFEVWFMTRLAKTQ